MSEWDEFCRTVEKARDAYVAAGIDTPEKARLELERLRDEETGTLLFVEWAP